MIYHRTHQPWTIRKNFFSFTNVMLFVLPIAGTQSINVVGELLFSDILVTVGFCVLLLQRRLRFNLPVLRDLLILLTFWFAGALISDLVNDSPLRNLLRGWAKLIFFTLYLIVFFNLIDGKGNRLLIAIYGLVVAAPLAIPSEFIETAGDSSLEIAWKFGIGTALSLGVGIGLLFLGVSRRSIAFGYMLLGATHLIMSARSLFLITFLSGLLALVARPIRSRKKRKKFALISVLILVIGISGGEKTYDRLVRSGLFGEELLEKHLNQTAGGTNVILGGRSESLISLVAIHDSPIFGHGSWSENKEYYLLYLQMIRSQGRLVNFDSAAHEETFLIPSHSYLLGAWVEHGLAGALFWVVTFMLTARALLLALFGRRIAQPFEIYLMLGLIWDILFSPFGSFTRCWSAISIALVGVVLQSEKVDLEKETQVSLPTTNRPRFLERTKQAS